MCNCVKSNFEGLPMGRGMDEWKGICGIVLIDLNPTYVVAKFGLAKHIERKVEKLAMVKECVIV